MKKAICPNYSCPSFALSLFTPFTPPVFIPSFFIQEWSISLVFITSVHFPFPHSTLAVCSFRMFTSSHLFRTPHPSLYELVSFSRGLHFPCSQIPVYPLLLSSPYLLHPSICCSLSQTALPHFSHLIIQLSLAFGHIKLLPDPSLPLSLLPFLLPPAVFCSFLHGIFL